MKVCPTGALAVVILALAGPGAVAGEDGNAAAGARVWRTCSACHTIAPGEPHRVGPNLRGIVGAVAATRPGYAYSAALRRANLVWDRPTLDAWLTRPQALVPGTRMTFAGLARAEDRADVIAYLRATGPEATGVK